MENKKIRYSTLRYIYISYLEGENERKHNHVTIDHITMNFLIL